MYRALRDITTGEELCINYGRLWFVDIEAEHAGSEEMEEDLLSGIEIEL